MAASEPIFLFGTGYAGVRKLLDYLAGMAGAPSIPFEVYSMGTTR